MQKLSAGAIALRTPVQAGGPAGRRGSRGPQGGASFPEILLMIGLFSLLATFVVPPVMNWFQDTQVSKTMRADCQTVILDAMHGSPTAQSQASRDCPAPVLVAPAAPAAAAASASASAATATPVAPPGTAAR